LLYNYYTEIMNKYKASLSIRIIFVINEIIFWLLTLVAAAAIVFAIIIWCGGFKEDMQLHVNLPVEFSSKETGLFMRGNSPVEVELVELTGSLYLIDTPHDLSSLFAIAMAIIMGIMFYMLFTFRVFMHNVRRGVIFDLVNIRQLKIISIGLFVTWILAKLYAYLMWLLVAKRLNFGTIEFSNDQRGFILLLFCSLFLWVLSHIFLWGVKLQEENSLTI